MNARTITDIIRDVAKEERVPRDTVKRVTDALFEQIEETLRSQDHLSIRGFGAFTVRNRAVKSVKELQEAEDPSTVEATIYKVVHFRPLFKVE